MCARLAGVMRTTSWRGLQRTTVTFPKRDAWM